jgi:hypothetical protein
MMEMNWCVYLKKSAQLECLNGAVGRNSPIFTRLSSAMTVFCQIKEGGFDKALF